MLGLAKQQEKIHRIKKPCPTMGKLQCCNWEKHKIQRVIIIITHTEAYYTEILCYLSSKQI